MGSGPHRAFEAHQTELEQRARVSALMVAVIAAVAVPVWSGFDLLLEPHHARAFIAVRLLGEVPVLAAVWLLRRRPARPQLLAVSVLALVQCEIAWMVSRASSSREFYLLGFTLALYGSGLLLAGSARGTMVTVLVTFAAFAVADLTTPTPLDARSLVAALTFLSTSSIIAVFAHAQRHRLTTSEFATREALETEQLHSRDLLVRLERQSRQDPLTELANRRAWDERLHAESVRAAAEGTDLALVLLDVDWFKQINDRHGHASGDDALRQVAAVLELRAPDGAFVARLGGDEFAVLLPGLTARDAVAFAERVRADAQACPVLGSDTVGVSVSQGVASSRGHDAAASLLMAQADRELYRAKATRNAVSADVVRVLPSPREREPQDDAARESRA
jgi:diguanylate cyclase (GGDEF)-like protein